MCNIRGYRHAGCGHIAQKCLSTCRGTYASPNCPRVPRCVHPGPSLVIHVNKSCRSCQHQAVCDAWTRRIDELKEKRDSLQSLLQEMGCAELDAWGCDDDDGGLSFGDISGSADTPFIGDSASCPGDCDGWCESKSCSAKPKPVSKKQRPVEELCCNWLDPPSLRNEQRRLSNEIERLQIEAEKDMWETSPQINTEPTGFRRKRRRTSPKVDGKSPLRIVTSSEDLRTPPSLEHSDSTDTNDSFCSGASSDDASTVSNVSVPTPTDSPDRSPPRSPTDSDIGPAFGKLRVVNASSTCPLTQLALAHQLSQKKENRKSEPPMLSKKWVRDLKRLSLEQSKKEVVDDGADDLLPAWNDA